MSNRRNYDIEMKDTAQCQHALCSGGFSRMRARLTETPTRFLVLTLLLVII
jgi:hypothetical protein